MANLSDKLGSLTFTPKSQSPASAGFIQAYAGTTAPQGWYLLDRADDTTIVDCETLYPELWDLANTNWRSGSDLVIPVSVYGESALKAYVPTVTGNNTGLSSYTLEYANWKANGRKMLVNCAVSSIVVTDASVTVIRMTLPSGITLPSPSNASVNALYTDDSGIYDAGYVECNGAVDNNEILIRPASGNWSNPSAFKFQLEFEIEGGDFPESIIKLYTDASNIAMSIADATASSTGAVRLSSDFAATSSQYGLVLANKWQSKVTASPVSTTGVITSLTFNNLVIGKVYKAKIFPFMGKTGNDSNDSNIRIDIENNSVSHGFTQQLIQQDAGTDRHAAIVSGEAIFTAAATTCEFNVTTITGATSYVATGSYATIEELNNYSDETTDFT
jgi:hypothetical protein